jgi:hypothetical protein
MGRPANKSGHEPSRQSGSRNARKGTAQNQQGRTVALDAARRREGRAENSGRMGLILPTSFGKRPVTSIASSRARSRPTRGSHEDQNSFGGRIQTRIDREQVFERRGFPTFAPIFKVVGDEV